MRAHDHYDAIANFERELVAFGLVLPRGSVVADGRIHRLNDGQHRRKNNGAGWYTLRELPNGLLYGKGGSWWRDRGGFKWNSRGNTKLTPADRKAIADLNRQLEAEKAQHYREGAERATQIWTAGKSCSSHPYLDRKGVRSHGLRIDEDGRLLIPLRDLDGNLRGVQRIDAKGEKRFTFGTDRERATCFVIGNLDNADNVAVVEGYATGATVHEATSWPVVVAFDAGALEKIARPLRKHLPKATLIFAGDHDLEEKGGRGQQAVQRAARHAGGVAALPPTEGHDWNDHAVALGLDDVRARLIVAAGIVELPPTVTLPKGVAQLDRIIGGFFDQAQAWHDLPEEQRPTPPAHLVNATMGAGKSHMARAAAGRFLERNMASAVGFALPLHRLTTEQAANFKDETGQGVAIWRGMDQPDPERDDGAKMCLQPELSKAAQDAGANVSEVCKVCPSRGECGYRRQAQQKASAWYFPHQLLFHPKPKAITAPGVLVIDEKFQDAGMAENIRLAASTLEGGISDVPHTGDRELLRELRGMLLAALKAAAETLPSGKIRSRISRAQIEATGLTADQAHDAQRIEWSRKPSPTLSGDVSDMVRDLQAMSGRFTPKVPILWRLVEDLLRGEYDVATTIEIEPDAKLQGGDGFGLVIRMNYRLDVHASWRCPAMVLDGTAKPEIVQHFFPALHVAPAVHIEAPHQRVTWVRASFTKWGLVAREGGSERQNKWRQNNIEDLRRFIEVKAAEYRGRGTGPCDVLVVTNKDIEELLLAGHGLPDNVTTEHFNNLRGTNDYERVRAVIVIGRPLPNARTIHRQAERLAGHQLDQDNPLVAAVRWSICEAELLQVIARARGIRRTESDPLDVLMLGDVPLPLKIDLVVSWEQAQPRPLELLAARGVMPACDTDAKGYWATIATLLPDLYPTVQAAKDAARGSQWNPSIGNTLIDESHREDWLPFTAKAHGARYGIPVWINPQRQADLVAILDLHVVEEHFGAVVAITSPMVAGGGLPLCGASSPTTTPRRWAPRADLGTESGPVATPAHADQHGDPSLHEPEEGARALSVGLDAPCAQPMADDMRGPMPRARAPFNLADLSAHAGGIMPPPVRHRWRAAEITQDDLAQRACPRTSTLPKPPAGFL